MITLLNKLLSRFNLQVFPKQEEPQKVSSFLDDITKPDFLEKHKDFLDRYLNAKGAHSTSLYVGDINYVKDKNGKTYYQDINNKKYFCDYDLKNPSKEVLGHMIEETTFTKEELKDKLK